MNITFVCINFVIKVVTWIVPVVLNRVLKWTFCSYEIPFSVIYLKKFVMNSFWTEIFLVVLDLVFRGFLVPTSLLEHQLCT